jgi:hypothetical protein
MNYLNGCSPEPTPPKLNKSNLGVPAFSNYYTSPILLLRPQTTYGRQPVSMMINTEVRRPHTWHYYPDASLSSTVSSCLPTSAPLAAVQFLNPSPSSSMLSSDRLIAEVEHQLRSSAASRPDTQSTLPHHDSTSPALRYTIDASAPWH